MTRLLVVEPGYCPYQAGFPSAMAAASEVIEGESQILKPFGTPRIGLISDYKKSRKITCNYRQHGLSGRCQTLYRGGNRQGKHSSAG